MRRNILIAVSLLILILVVALSLKRSSESVETDGEIRHFPAEVSGQNLQLVNGKTLEEYYDNSIHQVDHLRHHRVEANGTQSRVAAGTDGFNPHFLVEANGTKSRVAAEQKKVEIKPSYPQGVLLTHTVQEGETLHQLAGQYNVTPYQIRKRNHLDEDAILKVGQKLKIIPGEKPSYRVRPGDNLIRIGRRFGVDHREIIRLNHLDSDRAIWIGQKLVMPVSQKKIDTVLAEIARKKQEEIERKKRYERELLVRLTRQREARKRLAKARAEKKAKAKKEKQARLEQARRAFKYTESKKFKHKIRVVATAYTSHRSQTDRTPFLAAWNNRIRPGMKIIAVSPDLIRKYGITNGVRVKIAGLPGTYVVRDKMNARLHNHIDIYMGVNRRRALRWGRRRVVMYW